MMNINSTRHKLCGIANSNSSRSSKIVLSLSKIIKNKIGYSQSREFCRNESRQTRRRGTEVKIGRRMKMMIGNNNSWNNLNLNNAHIRRSNDSHSCDKRCIAISSFYLPKANNNRFFGNNVQNYKTRRTYSSRSNNTELSFLSRLEDETKYTKQYIEDMLSGIDSKYKIHPSIIEREIQDGASQIESSVPELGPTGEYAYYFDDDLIVGKRTYRRKKLNGKSTPALDDNSMMNNNKSNNSSNNEQTVFDMNLHFEFLGPMSISVDERFVVRMITYIDSGMKPKIVVTNIDSGINYIMRNGASQHQIHNVEFGPMYSKTHTSKADESYSLFLTTCDEIGRPSAVYACTFDGESFGQLELVVEDKDGANFVDVQRTKGCEYVAINSTSKTDNEVYLIGGEIVNRESSESSNGIPWQPILVKERKDGVQYFVDCGNKGEVIILAHEFPNLLNNDMGQKDHGGLGNEISVFEESIQSLPLASNYFGKSIHNHSDKSAFFVEDMDLFENYLVLYERSSIDSSQQIRILNRDSKGFDQHVVPLGELQGVEHQMITPGGNMHFYTNSLHFNIETPLEPPITCTYNCEKRSLTASSGSSHNSFHSKRFDIVSDDDVSIPLSLYFDKNVTTMGVLLIGYGSYGQNQNLAYDPALLPLVKRGFVIAFCHGRGGGDLGKMWYEAGRLYNKKNAIKDYIACAKALSEIEIPNIDPNSRSLFVGSKSFSAGGVVVAAAMNESPPGLFQAVSLTNPFLDVMGTMLTSGKSTHFLTEHEWDEFGDPTIDERAHSAISSYCPVLNINKNQSYPPMLIVSAIDDENVPYSNGVQYAFKVRNAMKENCNQGSHSLASVNGKKSNILLHVEKNGGHHLHGRRLDVCTLENCFFLAQLYANTCRR